MAALPLKKEEETQQQTGLEGESGGPMEGVVREEGGEGGAKIGAEKGKADTGAGAGAGGGSGGGGGGKKKKKGKK